MRPLYKSLQRSLFQLSILSLTCSGCSSMTIRYRAHVETEKSGGEGEFTYVHSYSTTGWAWACGLTFWIYGGSCWMYLGMPFSGDFDLAQRDGKKELNKLILEPFKISDKRFTRTNWSTVETEKSITWDQEPQKVSPSETKGPVSVAEFEKSIPEKLTREERINTNDQGFPNGWPEKWFYETDGYKYWTIVGDKAGTSAEAMILSKKKADQLIGAEFPKQAETIKYETTHNEVKHNNGRYVSWRIIRVRQNDIR